MLVARSILDLLRGALIGVVEVIPGVSGGTVALLVGLYDRLIASMSSFVRGVVHGVADVVRRRGLARARSAFAEVEWRLVVTVAAGMVAALLLAARAIEPLLDEHPEDARALFAGLIVASLVVPARMVGRWRMREVLLAIAGAVAAFVLTGLPSATVVEPTPLAIVGAAALAVCALVIPGISGSFVLLALGMYAPILAALNDRDLATISLFLVGAVIGIASFVRVLRWLLTRHRAVSLAVMTGLMLGSLRALWPCQSDERDLLAPSGDVGSVVPWFVVGLAVVVAFLVVERLVVRRRAVEGAEEA